MLNDQCEISIILAYAMSTYIIASLYYLIFTRIVGTPFNDSLTEEQIKIKNKSANKRRAIFYTGIVFAMGILYFIQPFSECA